MTTPNQLPKEAGPHVSIRGRKVRKITPRETFQLMQWEMDFRFVRECERLEREGRVTNRRDLERDLGFEVGGISVIRLGMRGCSAVHIKLLHEKYRGDRDYILHGVANKELAAPYIHGIGRIDRYDPYFHRYTSTARWKVGPRPETHPEYYPADPQNEQWHPPTTRSIKDLGERANTQTIQTP